MANSGKIGKVLNMLENLRRSSSYIETSPLSTIGMKSIENYSGDWQNVESTDKFIFGSHKWGDITKKVAK